MHLFLSNQWFDTDAPTGTCLSFETGGKTEQN